MAKSTKRRPYFSSIRSEVVRSILLVGAVMVVVSLFISYLLAAGIVWDILGKERMNIAQRTSQSITMRISEELQSIHILVSSLFWKDFVQSVNATRYSAMAPEEIAAYFSRMDARWAGSGPDDEAIAAILQTPLSKRLKAIVEEDPGIAEMFITDELGGLVAASGKTTDFYQADENWWQAAYAGGRGNDYIGEVEYDESSEVYSIAFAVPVFGEHREIVGICKTVVRISAFFSRVTQVKLGKTGDAGIINKDGYFIFHDQDTAPFKERFCAKEEMAKIAHSGYGWAKIQMEINGIARIVQVSYAKIGRMVSSGQSIDWWVVIWQERAEVLAPIRYLVIGLFLISIISIIGIALLGFRWSDRVVGPIKKLRDGVMLVGNGYLDHTVGTDAQNEIGELSREFDRMVEHLKRSHREIEAYSKQLEDAKMDLEIKVVQRTTELQQKIEELKDTQDRLVRSERLAALGKLSGIVSHELRNPLGVIRNSLYFLRMKLAKNLEDEKIKQHFDILEEEVRISDKIISDILFFSRIKEPELKRTNFNNVMGSSLKKVVMPENVEIIFDSTDGLPEVMADGDQLAQVFCNLVLNSLQAMPHGGRITLRGAKTDKFIEISVIDTGEGILKENLDKIFEPFFSTRARGTGLGLSICKSIIENHKGKMGVKSEPGKGAEFIIQFPVGGT